MSTGVDHGSVLVDQTRGRDPGGERRTADRDLALTGLSSQALNLLSRAAGGQTGGALDRGQRREKTSSSGAVQSKPPSGPTM